MSDLLDDLENSSGREISDIDSASSSSSASSFWHGDNDRDDDDDDTVAVQLDDEVVVAAASSERVFRNRRNFRQNIRQDLQGRGRNDDDDDDDDIASLSLLGESRYLSIHELSILHTDEVTEEAKELAAEVHTQSHSHSHSHSHSQSAEHSLQEHSRYVSMECMHLCSLSSSLIFAHSLPLCLFVCLVCVSLSPLSLTSLTSLPHLSPSPLPISLSSLPLISLPLSTFVGTHHLFQRQHIVSSLMRRAPFREASVPLVTRVFDDFAWAYSHISPAHSHAHPLSSIHPMFGTPLPLHHTAAACIPDAIGNLEHTVLQSDRVRVAALLERQFKLAIRARHSHASRGASSQSAHASAEANHGRHHHHRHHSSHHSTSHHTHADLEPRTALRILRHVQAVPTSGYVRVAAWSLSKILPWLVSSVRVCEDGISRIHRAVADGHTIVYAPTYRSHLDHLLLVYVCFAYGLPLPHSAVDERLASGPLGSFLRRIGSMFIKRSFPHDQLYQSVVEEYVAAVMQLGLSLQFFIEGDRSQSGRLRRPRLGFLASLVQAYLQQVYRTRSGARSGNGIANVALLDPSIVGDIDPHQEQKRLRRCLDELADVVIIPVSLSYDRVIETTDLANCSIPPAPEFHMQAKKRNRYRQRYGKRADAVNRRRYGNDLGGTTLAHLLFNHMPFNRSRGDVHVGFAEPISLRLHLMSVWHTGKYLQDAWLRQIRQYAQTQSHVQHLLHRPNELFHVSGPHSSDPEDGGAVEQLPAPVPVSVLAPSRLDGLDRSRIVPPTVERNEHSHQQRARLAFAKKENLFQDVLVARVADEVLRHLHASSIVPSTALVATLLLASWHDPWWTISDLSASAGWLFEQASQRGAKFAFDTASISIQTRKALGLLGDSIEKKQHGDQVNPSVRLRPHNAAARATLQYFRNLLFGFFVAEAIVWNSCFSDSLDRVVSTSIPAGASERTSAPMPERGVLGRQSADSDDDFADISVHDDDGADVNMPGNDHHDENSFDHKHDQDPSSRGTPSSSSRTFEHFEHAPRVVAPHRLASSLGAVRRLQLGKRSASASNSTVTSPRSSVASSNPMRPPRRLLRGVTRVESSNHRSRSAVNSPRRTPSRSRSRTHQSSAHTQAKLISASTTGVHSLPTSPRHRGDAQLSLATRGLRRPDAHHLTVFDERPKLSFAGVATGTADAASAISGSPDFSRNNEVKSGTAGAIPQQSARPMHNSSGSSSKSRFWVSQQRVVQEASFLCNLLEYETPFFSKHERTASYFEDVIDKMEENGAICRYSRHELHADRSLAVRVVPAPRTVGMSISMSASGTSTTSTSANAASSLNGSSDVHDMDEDDTLLCVDSNFRDHRLHALFHDMLEPVVSVYWCCIVSVSMLELLQHKSRPHVRKGELPMSEFIEMIRCLAMRLHADFACTSADSLCGDTIGNACKKLIDMHILERIDHPLHKVHSAHRSDRHARARDHTRAHHKREHEHAHDHHHMEVQAEGIPHDSVALHEYDHKLNGEPGEGPVSIDPTIPGASAHEDVPSSDADHHRDAVSSRRSSRRSSVASSSIGPSSVHSSLRSHARSHANAHSNGHSHSHSNHAKNKRAFGDESLKFGLEYKAFVKLHPSHHRLSSSIVYHTLLDRVAQLRVLPRKLGVVGSNLYNDLARANVLAKPVALSTALDIQMYIATSMFWHPELWQV
jgi:Glycerol-3-phosphate acyltransferase C-terminal region/Acyltransferase